MKKNIYKIIALSLLLTPGGAAAEDARTRLVGDGWFEMPFRPSQQNPQGEYIYFVGGYNSEDRGTPPWGSLVESENLFIGDRAGEIVIAYADGTADVIPLIFGYTMWFKANWRDGGAPFKTDEAEPAMTACLRKALQLQGGFEGNDQTAIKVKIQSKPIREIRLADNPRKAGEPVFDGGYLLRSDERKTLSGGKPVDAADPFFDTHTIDSRRPDTMRREIERMRRRLYTFESDFKKAPAFKYPETYERARISFTGNRFADILTQVYYYNVEDILTKMRDDGMIDESSPGAPSWRYDGFGTWVPQANSYCGAMYSRNRALGILSYLDLLPKTQKSVDFLHKCLMYYPDNGLTMLGKRIPGHWSVIPNKPMEYSKVLVPVANWPTQYTKELFGNDYQNFGNSEPDGHGLTMMSIANVWRNGGADPQWVLDNWTYVNEAVHYIDWAMKNPDISFNKNGLMYGETEAAMMDYTMFANIPCYLGVRMYVEMAQAAGKTREATVCDRTGRPDGAGDPRRILRRAAVEPGKVRIFPRPVDVDLRRLRGLRRPQRRARSMVFALRQHLPERYRPLYRQRVLRAARTRIRPQHHHADLDAARPERRLRPVPDQSFETVLQPEVAEAVHRPGRRVVQPGAGNVPAPRRSRQFRAAERNRPDDPDGGRHFESAGQRRQDHAPAAENMERRSKRPDRSRQRSENQLPGDLSGK